MNNSTNSQERKAIEECLSRIHEFVLEGVIENEDDLDDYVRIYTDKQRAKIAKQFGGEIKSTLLEALGYTSANCDKEPVLMQQIGSGMSKTRPDFILRSGGKDVATIDLKSPVESLDNTNHLAQLHYYCCTHELRPVPLGMLFNGRSLRVFVNINYVGLTKYKAKFAPYIDAKSKSPNLIEVVSVEFSEDPTINAKALKLGAEEICRLRHFEVPNQAVKLASDLAKRKLNQIGSIIRVRSIRQSLQEALAHPTEEIIRAVASAISVWKNLDGEPSVDEVVSAWHTAVGVPPTVAKIEAVAKTSINALVRQRVAEVCEKHGWQYVVNTNVKGLRYRDEGGNGYHPVPQGPGVPENLHVGGLCTADAKKVIQQLEKLI